LILLRFKVSTLALTLFGNQHRGHKVQAQGPNGVVVRIGETATIQTIKQLHGELRAGFAGSGGVTVDASAIGEVDLTFVQLIESARRTAAESGRQFTLSAPVDGELLEVLQRGGFLATADGAAFWRCQNGAL
jgi:hypothetical protein